jgi:murein L,D-transpeptidase YafK
MASAVAAAAVALASCNTDGLSDNPRAMKPLSSEMVALLEQKHMPKESPLLVRIFKEEAELEVWKQDDSGHFALLKTYPICRWSGDLGPKIKEGDRQAPEGYYTITPGQMNPNSNYYLSFNLGFPNAYDKANDRTGAFLMVHGDCSSAGCYAMTDEQIGEIYALGRESFFGGQQAFQVQAYPFRMTPLNMAKHRSSPHLAFWRMIKQGYDHFEVTRQEPKVDVCDKHYVFDAAAPQASATPVTFNPRGRCPAYEIPQDIAAGVKEKHDNDEREFAELVARGTPTVAAHMATDGGMNPVFAAKLKPDIFDGDGRVRTVASAPGTVPPNVNPPPAPETTTGATRKGEDPAPSKVFGGFFSTASAESKPAPAPVAQSASGDKTNENPLDRFSKWVGLRSDPPPPPPPDPSPAAAAPKPKAKPVETARAAVTRPHAPSTLTAQTQSQPQTQPQTAQPQTAQSKPQQQMATVQPAPPPPSPPAATQPTATFAQPAGPTVMPGALPVVPSASFDSRWGGVR